MLTVTTLTLMIVALLISEGRWAVRKKKQNSEKILITNTTKINNNLISS